MTSSQKSVRLYEIQQTAVICDMYHVQEHITHQPNSGSLKTKMWRKYVDTKEKRTARSFITKTIHLIQLSRISEEGWEWLNM
jgi:uncharacterized Fe-S center protein